MDIVAKGKVFTPWKEDINIEIPLEVKAEMTDIKGFLEEADNIIRVSKVTEDKAVVKEKTKEIVIRDENKRKSKFSIMLEQDKECPEGQKF